MDHKEEKEDSQSEEQLEQKEVFEEEDLRITDPQLLLDFCGKDKKIKIMDENNPIFSQVFLKDISLHKKGPMEDKIYSKIDKYYINIRRGNTLCQIYHPNQINQKVQAYDLFICRRGMKKFYDLEPEYLKVGASLSPYHRNVKKRIFEKIDYELDRPGTSFHLYCLFKENGEHCQVSYLKELQSWLFASKNVAILARTPEDLENHYHKERFIWAKMVGEEFFNVLAKMSEEQRSSFKKDLEGFTLLGEHCGHEDHQHITKYDKVEIIWYGLVKNVGFDHCQPVEECRTLLQKYNLKMSICRERKGLTDKNKLLATMWQFLKEVAEGTMNKEGEGSVMYVVAQKECQQKTVAMCKLKTSEYLIYRRLRQMLKLNVSRKGATANTFEKFIFQIEELVKHYFKPPKPLDFYFQLGEKAFKQCNKNGQIDQTYLRYKFVDFIAQFQEEKKNRKVPLIQIQQQPQRIIIVCLPRLTNTIEKFCKSRGYQIDSMFRPGKPITKTVVHILYMIPRLPQKLQEDCEIIIPQYENTQINACIADLQQCKDLSKSQLITFVKSEDKAKNIAMLHGKIEGFRKNCKDNSIKINSVAYSQENVVKCIQDIMESKRKQVILEQSNGYQKPIKTFVLPLLIPGSGKSTLAKQISSKAQSKFKWKIIDSDAIRRQLMEEIKQIDLDEDSSNKIFFQTGSEATHKFNEQLLKQASQEPTQNECIYVDRIFSPLNIEQTIDTLLKTQKDYIRVSVLSQTFMTTKLNDKTYPYSMNYLLTCLRRCIERTGHKTMPNDPYVVAKIVIKFYQMTVSFTPKTINKRFEDKVSFVALPFVEDNQQNNLINHQTKKKIEECLSKVQPGHQAKDCECFIQLVQNLYKFDEKAEKESLDNYTKLLSVLEQTIENKVHKL